MQLPWLAAIERQANYLLQLSYADKAERRDWFTVCTIRKYYTSYTCQQYRHSSHYFVMLFWVESDIMWTLVVSSIVKSSHTSFSPWNYIFCTVLHNARVRFCAQRLSCNGIVVQFISILFIFYLYSLYVLCVCFYLFLWFYNSMWTDKPMNEWMNIAGNSRRNGAENFLTVLQMLKLGVIL